MKLFRYLLSWFLLTGSIVGVGFGLYFLIDDGDSIFMGIFIGFYTINLIATIVVFTQRRQTAGKLTWIIMFLLFPFIAHAAFALFGQRYKGRATQKEYRKRQSFKYEKYRKINLKTNVDIQLMKQSEISGRGIYKANLEMFSKGDEAFKELFKDLENAKKFIHLQYYILKPGEIFDHLKDILIRKAKEGLEIRLIVDDFGRWAVPWYEIKLLEKSGIQIQRYCKISFPFIDSHNAYRMHRKVAIIDGSIVHTGGVNVANEYANMNKKYGLWIDYQVRITGEAVRSYSLVYLDDWNTVSGEKIKPEKYLNEDNIGESKIVLIEDSPENNELVIQTSLLAMIHSAKREIVITTPYFVPTPEIFAALLTAVKSGVKLKIIIPGKPDKKTVMPVSKYYGRILARFGAVILQADNLLIHSKMGIFDNEYAYTGTTNMDARSMYAQWEFIQLITGPAVKEVKKAIDSYLKKTININEELLSTSKAKEKITRFYVNLFTPIM